MSTACILWCHSGVSTVNIAHRSFTLVAGDLLYISEGFSWRENSTGLILPIAFPEDLIQGPTRRIHVGQRWGDRLVYEYSRSLFGEPRISSEIARLFQDRVGAPPVPVSRNAKIVAQKLVSNPADQTSLEQFADQQGIAARTLQRQFLKCTNLTFSEWRAAQRVSVAASLLAHDFSISVTANLVGFAAASSLTRAFRRHTGSTPSAFTTSSIGMGTAGEPPRIPAKTSFAKTARDQQLWIYTGTATVTTPGYCRFLGQGDMATIPAGTQTRIDVAAGSIAIPVPVGTGEVGLDLDLVVDCNKRGLATPQLNLLEEAQWKTLSEELLNTPVPVQY